MLMRRLHCPAAHGLAHGVVAGTQYHSPPDPRRERLPSAGIRREPAWASWYSLEPGPEHSVIGGSEQPVFPGYSVVARLLTPGEPQHSVHLPGVSGHLAGQGRGSCGNPRLAAEQDQTAHADRVCRARRVRRRGTGERSGFRALAPQAAQPQPAAAAAGWAGALRALSCCRLTR